MPWVITWARSTIDGLRKMVPPPDVTPQLCQSCKATWAVMPVFCLDTTRQEVLPTDYVRCLHCGAQYEWKP